MTVVVVRNANSISLAEHAVDPGEQAVGGGASRSIIGRRPLAFDRLGVAARARRQVLVDRLIAELGQQVEAAALGYQPRHRAVGVAQVAEMARSRRTGAH